VIYWDKEKSRDQSLFSISLFKWPTVFQFASLSPSPFVQNFITGLCGSMARARRFSLFSLNLPAAPNERLDLRALNAKLTEFSNKRHCQDFIYSSARESADSKVSTLRHYTVNTVTITNRGGPNNLIAAIYTGQ
jgi:hypothetical protein